MTDYPRCKTCRSYKDATCAHGKLVSMDDDGMVAGSTLVEVSDLTSWDENIGPLSVGPDFGCIHHSTLHPEDDDGD